MLLMNESTTDPAAPVHDVPPAEPGPGSYRIWAVLLVLDSVFVIVFGGLVASKVYQHWSEPSVARVLPQRHRSPRAAAPAAPAPVAAVTSAPTAAAPEPSAAATAPTASVPEPSKPESAPPAPAASAAAAAAVAERAAPTEGKARARAVDFKLKARGASSVQVVGAFIVHGGRKEMTRRPDGVWTARLYLNPGRYRYFFFIDGRRVLDPANAKSDHGASVLTVSQR